MDLEIRVPTCEVRELRASECQGFSLKWNRGVGYRRLVGGRDVHHTFSMPHGHAVPGQGAELWVWRSAIAGMGGVAVSSAVRSVSGASRGDYGPL